MNSLANFEKKVNGIERGEDGWKEETKEVYIHDSLGSFLCFWKITIALETRDLDEVCKNRLPLLLMVLEPRSNEWICIFTGSKRCDDDDSNDPNALSPRQSPSAHQRMKKNRK